MNIQGPLFGSLLEYSMAHEDCFHLCSTLARPTRYSSQDHILLGSHQPSHASSNRGSESNRQTDCPSEQPLTLYPTVNKLSWSLKELSERKSCTEAAKAKHNRANDKRVLIMKFFIKE